MNTYKLPLGEVTADFVDWLQKFDTLLVKSRFPRPGLLMNSRTYLSF